MRTIRKNSSTGLVGAALLMSLCARGAKARSDEPVDYGQLGAILGYVSADYGTAVGPAGVLSTQEYGEQRGFLAEAAGLTGALSPEDADVVQLLSAAKADTDRAAPPSVVVPKVSQALALLEQRHDLGLVPRQQPSFAHGRELFSQACEACHAADGSGMTSLKLSTQPPDLRDPKQSGPLSPARIFSAVSYGVPGTAMPSFDQAYGPNDRWDLAFYFQTLAHAGQGRDSSRLTQFALSELAAQTDDALRAALDKQGASPQAREAQLASLRVDGPYSSAIARANTQLLAGARLKISEAQRQDAAGNARAAKHAAISAYLDDVEPFEAALRAKDPTLVSVLEAQFGQLRALLDAGAPPTQVASVAEGLQRSLLKAEDAVTTGNASVSFTASLAIALREGLEAALLLSALLALASKSRRPRAVVAVHLGWVVALLGGAATWLLSGLLLSRGGQSRELTEGITVLLTAVLLLGASHWILAQASAKKLTSFLSQRAKLVSGAGWGLGVLAFLAIYREMFEIVVFYRGLLLQSPGQTRAVGLGVLVGLVALAGIVVGFQRLVGRKLKPRPLLITCGALLCALSVVMVGEGVRSLQEAGVLGQRLIRMPEIPQLGVFATAEGLSAQLLIVVGLLASVLYSTLRAPPPPGAWSKS